MAPGPSTLKIVVLKSLVRMTRGGVVLTLLTHALAGREQVGQLVPPSLIVGGDNRVRVERTPLTGTRYPPVLKITRSVLTGYENSLLYLIPQPLTRNAF